jgi:four helix bundle protein
MGPASELVYHLLLARDPGYLPENNHNPLDSQVMEFKRMLVALVKKVDTGRKGATGGP